jgi:predicted type IV restriction endonuclease
MQESFEELILRVSGDQAIIQGTEEGVRQAIILPILNCLGWNIYDVKEVHPEFSVEGTFVDYCLKVLDKRVFLEIKRVSADLGRNEKQLLDYSFKVGVDMAVLTNGMLWWLYLPLTKGEWKQRKFFTIDIQQQEPKKAAAHFKEFLSRDSIKDNSAIESAQAMHDSKQKQRLLPLAI